MGTHVDKSNIIWNPVFLKAKKIRPANYWGIIEELGLILLSDELPCALRELVYYVGILLTSQIFSLQLQGLGYARFAHPGPVHTTQSETIHIGLPCYKETLMSSQISHHFFKSNSARAL